MGEVRCCEIMVSVCIWSAHAWVFISLGSIVNNLVLLGVSQCVTGRLDLIIAPLCTYFLYSEMIPPLCIICHAMSSPSPCPSVPPSHSSPPYHPFPSLTPYVPPLSICVCVCVPKYRELAVLGKPECFPVSASGWWSKVRGIQYELTLEPYLSPLESL